MKTYDFIDTYADDADMVRRRLLVKLLRAKSCSHHDSYAFTGWCSGIADTIERGEPLEYFRRLGEDKTSTKCTLG